MEFVARRRNKPLYGRGDFSPEVVGTAGLSIVPDTSVHERHANLEGWPAEDPEILNIAILLAESSIYVPSPLT
jgi:hypothetical protein